MDIRIIVWISSLIILVFSVYIIAGVGPIGGKVFLGIPTLLSVLALVRKAEWGRILAIFVLFYITAVWFFAFLPISGRPHAHWLEVYLGFIPNTMILWVVIMMGTTLFLGCAYFLSKHKSAFRS